MAVIRLTQEIDRAVADVFTTVIDCSEFPLMEAPPSSDRVNSRRVRWAKERGSNGHFVASGTSCGNFSTFTDLGRLTRVEHDLQMRPKGGFVLIAPSWD